MERRQDNEAYKQEKMTRTKRNASLYKELNSNISYEEVKDLSNNGTVIDLSSLKDLNSRREDYQAVKDYKELLDDRVDDKKEEKVSREIEKKKFDINAVLEEAKRNRKADDELEKKRKLEGDENVLTSLNKKYLHSKDFSKEDSDELKELIDTITSKTLVDDIQDEEEKELLSDLLATTIDIKLEKELSNEDINKLYDKEEKNLEAADDNIEADDKIENSFFTHSVKLSRDDLEKEEKEYEDEETEEDDEDEEDIGNGSTLKIILISAFLLVLVLVITYFVLKLFGISII